MTFKELKFKTHAVGDIQAVVKFENGYEVSVVQNRLSYGGEKGLYEIGVFDALGRMCDPLGWDDDIKGFLTPEGVEKELDLISNL